MSTQHFSRLFTVGDRHTQHFDVCWSSSGETTRITTIVEVRRRQNVRVYRDRTPETWAKVRAALLRGDTILYKS